MLSHVANHTSARDVTNIGLAENIKDISGTVVNIMRGTADLDSCDSGQEKSHLRVRVGAGELALTLGDKNVAWCGRYTDVSGTSSAEC